MPPPLIILRLRGACFLMAAPVQFHLHQKRRGATPPSYSVLKYPLIACFLKCRHHFRDGYRPSRHILSSYGRSSHGRGRCFRYCRSDPADRSRNKYRLAFRYPRSGPGAHGFQFLRPDPKDRSRCGNSYLRVRDPDHTRSLRSLLLTRSSLISIIYKLYAVLPAPCLLHLSATTSGTFCRKCPYPE